MPEHNCVSYPLGSHRRWLETLLFLVSPFLIVYISACMLVHDALFYPFRIGWMASAALALVSMLLACFAIFSRHLPSSSEHGDVLWLSDITMNLAYGYAEQDGIRFRKWFRERFVAWKAIERLEFWPNLDGRISLHLYSERSPIIFVPEFPEKQTSTAQKNRTTTVDFISQKLNETWPGKSSFVITYQSPAAEPPGMLTAVMRKLSPRQRALANALCVFLSFVLFFAVVGIRIAHRGLYFTALFLLLVIAAIYASSSRRPRGVQLKDEQRQIASDFEPPNRLCS